MRCGYAALANQAFSMAQVSIRSFYVIFRTLNVARRQILRMLSVGLEEG